MTEKIIGKKAWDLALKTLARHDQSEAMLTVKLKARGIDETEINLVIEKAKAYNFINDIVFAKNILQKAKEKGKTDLWIAAKLLSCGVNKSLIKELVSMEGMEEYE